jgi:hypothetical protein
LVVIDGHGGIVEPACDTSLSRPLPFTHDNCRPASPLDR